MPTTVRVAAAAAWCAVASLTVPGVAAAQPSIPVRVVNKAVAVQPAPDPVAFTLCTAEGEGAIEKCAAFGNPPAYHVPGGRRLILEQVSGTCGGDGEVGRPLTADIIATTKGVVVAHTIIGIPNAENIGGRIPLTLTRIYADGNSSLTIGLVGVPAVDGRFCRLAFSGQLVNP